MIMHPDPKLWVCQYLLGELDDDVFVGIKLEDPRPDRSVIVRSDGGQRLDVLRKRHRVGINVRALEPFEASELSRLVSALLWEAPEAPGSPITRVREPISGQDVPDEAPLSRLYSSFEIDFRGADS